MSGRRRGRFVALATAGAGLGLRELLRRQREFDLQGKTVLITGGSRGLGLALAREFAAEGARLVYTARDEAELERAREDLEGRGAQVLPVPADITDRAQVDELVRAAVARFGSVDVLVNNAGIVQVGPMETMTIEDYEQAMAIHFWAPLYATLAVLPGMRARRAGRIVNISSIGGIVSMPHLLPYNASKFALTGLSEGLRAELAKDGILVTTVCPGLMRTGSPRHALFKGQHRAEYAWFALGDALPLTSMAADRAARQIVAACRRGDPEVILTIQAQLAAKVHGLAPGLTADVLGLVNRLLPRPGGVGTRAVPGAESESPVTRSPLTALDEEAAREYNQVASGAAVRESASQQGSATS
jgi:NAD(P)-dependent dehydrogenase (short-subunit alcohol dehydrogenase family)